MTVRAYIKCPTCDCAIVLKLQIDQSISTGWHLRFDCPSCGDSIDIPIDGSNNIKNSITESEVTSGYILGYNPILPNSRINYFSPFKEAIEINFSLGIFMALCSIIGADNVTKHSSELLKIQENLLPFSNWLKDLLPMLKSKNNKAFFKKLATQLLNKKEYDDTGNAHDAYQDLIYASYENMASSKYKKIVSPILLSNQQSLLSADHASILEFKKLMKDLNIVIGSWKLEHAYSVISEYVDNIKDYLQSLLYFNNGNFEIPHDVQLFTTTISHKNAMSFYAKAFECYMKIFPYMVAIDNYCNYGQFENFGAEDPKFNDLRRFCSLSYGKQIEIISDGHPSNNWLLSALSNDLRNGNNHGSYRYDTLSQTITVLDNNDQSKEIHHESLFDLCQRTHILILHIIEAIKMGNYFNKISQ